MNQSSPRRHCGESNDIERINLRLEKHKGPVAERTPAGAPANKPATRNKTHRANAAEQTENPVWVSPALEGPIPTLAKTPGVHDYSDLQELLKYSDSESASQSIGGNQADFAGAPAESETPEPEMPDPPKGYREDRLILKVFPDSQAESMVKTKKLMDPRSNQFSQALHAFIGLQIEPEGPGESEAAEISLLHSNEIKGGNSSIPVYKLEVKHPNGDGAYQIMRNTFDSSKMFSHMFFQGYDVQFDWVVEHQGIRVCMEKIIVGGFAAPLTLGEYKAAFIRAGMPEDRILSVEESEIDDSKRAALGGKVKHLKKWINFYCDPQIGSQFGPETEISEDGKPKKHILLPPPALFMEYNGVKYYRHLIVSGACKHCCGPKHSDACPYSKYCRRCLLPTSAFREKGHACGMGFDYINVPAQTEQPYSVDMSTIKPPDENLQKVLEEQAAEAAAQAAAYMASQSNQKKDSADPKQSTKKRKKAEPKPPNPPYKGSWKKPNSSRKVTLLLHTVTDLCVRASEEPRHQTRENNSFSSSSIINKVFREMKILIFYSYAIYDDGG